MVSLNFSSLFIDWFYFSILIKFYIYSLWDRDMYYIYPIGLIMISVKLKVWI